MKYSFAELRNGALEMCWVDVIPNQTAGVWMYISVFIPVRLTDFWEYIKFVFGIDVNF